MDGLLLSALTHPHFGKMMLQSMGFTSAEQELLFDGINNYRYCENVRDNSQPVDDAHLSFSYSQWVDEQKEACKGYHRN